MNIYGFSCTICKPFEGGNRKGILVGNTISYAIRITFLQSLPIQLRKSSHACTLPLGVKHTREVGVNLAKLIVVDVAMHGQVWVTRVHLCARTHTYSVTIHPHTRVGERVEACSGVYMVQSAREYVPCE